MYFRTEHAVWDSGRAIYAGGMGFGGRPGALPLPLFSYIAPWSIASVPLFVVICPPSLLFFFLITLQSSYMAQSVECLYPPARAALFVYQLILYNNNIMLTA